MRPAAPRHWSSVTLPRRTPTDGIAVAAIDRDVTPSPTRTQASSGSAAASPHTPTGLPTASPASAANWTSRSTAGCQGSVSWARALAIRSAAIAYWVRSLVPMEKKSTSARKRSAWSATEGTSTMMPGFRPRARQRAENSKASSTVGTMGAITHASATPAPAAASAIASSWRSTSPGLVQPRRMPRTPSEGLASSSWLANGTGLSEPASSVRTTTLRPANAAKTSP